MSSENLAPPLRLVVDPGVYVAAAISGRGAPAELLEAATEGRVVLLVSPLLEAELQNVLSRGKFRKYMTMDEANAFIGAVLLVAVPIDDPPEDERLHVCRDPKDDYLVSLAHHSDATLLVSGDRDLLELDRSGVDVRTPRQTMDALAYKHPWGSSLIPAAASTALRRAEAEGHDQVLLTAAAFLNVVQEDNAAELLTYVATPESAQTWISQLKQTREMLVNRGMATRVEYPAVGVAYVKLPPDPGDPIVATEGILLPPNSVVLTLQRREELEDVLGLGGWRVHSVGDYLPTEDLPGSSGA